MNVEYLNTSYPKLLSQMEASGYSARYVRRFELGIQWVLQEAHQNGWRSYQDARHYFSANTETLCDTNAKRAVIEALEQFEISGKCPDSKWNPLIERGAYSKLNPEYRGIVDFYAHSEARRGMKDTTVRTRLQYINSFLSAMQSAGFPSLKEVTEEAVMSLFVSSDGMRLKGNSYRVTVLAMLTAYASLQPEACNRIISFIPKLRAARKNIQYLTAQEIEKIRYALNDRNNALSLCDRAVGTLALYTGLRGSDIASLSLDSIDWDSDTIEITQNKTGNPFTLPLTTTVGNAIFDYMTHERPVNQDAALFICTNGANRRITANSMWNVSARIMNAAGIRRNKGDRKGLHIFRHHLATTLLENNISQAVISHTLGHSLPNSCEPYLSADFINLKACALDVSSFPITKGVCGYE